jgi:isoquinoline 1-oxidoreductase beta subunit
VFCAADAGLVLDERNFRRRIISNIVSELSTATGRKIADDDAADRHISRRPEIEVELLANSERRAGGGRPAVPAVTPALANAIFALTGQRVHHQPLFDAVTFV